MNTHVWLGLLVAAFALGVLATLSFCAYTYRNWTAPPKKQPEYRPRRSL